MQAHKPSLIVNAFSVYCALIGILLFLAAPINVIADESSLLDVDANGKQTPLTDGLLIIRHLFGFTGTALTQGAVDLQGQRRQAEDITAYLNENLSTLDIDDSGKTAPLTDGLLIIRYLFGFTDSALLTGAIGDSATRKTAADITGYLQAMSNAGASISVGDGDGETTLSAKSFFEASVSSVVLENCQVCHRENGAAGSTPLRYIRPPDNAPDDPQVMQQNYETLRSYIVNGNGETLLNKARGVGHGGGAVLSSASEGYSTLEEFVGLVSAEAGLSDPSKPPIATVPEGFFKPAALLSARSTLRRASILILGRNPLPSEEALLDGEDPEALSNALTALTRAPGFHAFVTRAANDRLLTDAFLEGIPLEQSNIEGNPFYPLATNAFVAAQAEAAERFFYWPKYSHWRWGLTRAPVELIGYVVSNDRDYREVLTADYMMMNYAVNDFLDGGASFETADPDTLPYCQDNPNQPCFDHKVFKPGKHRGQVLLDEYLVTEDTDLASTKILEHGDFVDYPHAGLLTTQAFLNRYPSTETNRNRARARWVFYHFLGIDIEKSAPRTTDPEALADSNNPTLKNPACTVCHQVLDPLAGAFERFGDVGYYHESWGGNDSLPYNYKSAIPDPTSSPSYLIGETVAVDQTTFEMVSSLSVNLQAGTVYYRVSYLNDAADSDGDRNVFYDSLSIYGPSETQIIEFENLPEDSIITGCGGPGGDSYGQYCQGTLVIPITTTESGTHQFELRAREDPFGSESVQLNIALDLQADSLDQLGYQTGDTWYKDMRAPGYLNKTAPPDVESLSWAAQAIVDDPWFAEAAVKFWWPALMGSEAAVAPEVESDAGFDAQMALFEEQNAFIQLLGAEFANGINGGNAFNGRDLIVELLLSPWFRANAAIDSASIEGKLGTRRLLTPEELEAKFFHLAGFYWGDDGGFSEWQFDGRYSHLTDPLNILYGGIDSRNVTQRADEMSAVMFNIAEKMSLATACEIVSREFNLPKADRRVFSDIDLETTPSRLVVEAFNAKVSNTSFETVIEFERDLPIGPITAAISFHNDYASHEFGDREALLKQLTITEPSGATIVIELANPPDGAKIVGCGNLENDFYRLSCNSTLYLPINLSQSGKHSFALTAAGEQAGDEAVAIELVLVQTSDVEAIGEPALKNQLAALHWKLLGESAEDDTEILASYDLLLESLQQSSDQQALGLEDWPYQSCQNHNWRGEPLNVSDANGMKGAWMTVLTYFMTDFKFLHE